MKRGTWELLRAFETVKNISPKPKENEQKGNVILPNIRDDLLISIQHDD